MENFYEQLLANAQNQASADINIQVFAKSESRYENKSSKNNNNNGKLSQSRSMEIDDNGSVHRQVVATVQVPNSLSSINHNFWIKFSFNIIVE